MSTGYLLDTDTCIEIIKSKNPEIRTRFNCVPSSAIAISAITLGELRFGVENNLHPQRHRPRQHQHGATRNPVNPLPRQRACKPDRHFARTS